MENSLYVDVNLRNILIICGSVCGGENMGKMGVINATIYDAACIDVGTGNLLCCKLLMVVINMLVVRIINICNVKIV